MGSFFQTFGLSIIADGYLEEFVSPLLATTKRVGKLQALSHRIAAQGSDIVVSYLPEFVAKTESVQNPLPRSFSVKSLGEFLGDLPEERLLCPVRAVRVCLGMTSSLTPRPRSLFVSPRSLSHAVSKNAISYFLRWVILEAGVLWDGVPGAPRAHSIRGLATSAAFLHNWSVSKVLEAATWRSNPVFASFCFKDISYFLANCGLLGPFITVGSVIA